MIRRFDFGKIVLKILAWAPNCETLFLGVLPKEEEDSLSLNGITTFSPNIAFMP
jgi:hypothetical protein